MSLKKCMECGVPISTKADICPQCGAPSKRDTSPFTWLVVILFALGAYSFFRGEHSATATKPVAVSAPDPTQQLKITYTWQLSGFGNVMLLKNVIIKNPTSVAMKDPFIRCSLYAASDTALGDAEITVYQPLPAHGKIVAQEINMGLVNSQTKKASCRIPLAARQ